MWEADSIITLIVAILTFLLNIHQSVKHRHFDIDCSKCCSLKYDSDKTDGDSS